MRTLLYCYALSGVFSLGYQVVWLRHFVDRFGSGTFTFVLVICCFIGGLGIGAMASRRVSDGLRRLLRIDNDLVLYGTIEVMIATTALLVFVERFVPMDLAGSFPYVDRGGIYEPTLTYHLLRVPLAVTTVLLPCFLMGITYPLLCRVFQDRPRFPSSLYAWNTLGACTAVLACEFFFIHYLGTLNTLVVMVAGNFLLGLFFVARGRSLLGSYQPLSEEARQAELDTLSFKRTVVPTFGTLLAGAAISGFLSGAVEADAFRRMQFEQVYNDSAMAFVSFWAIAAIFLGSWLVHRQRSWWLRHIKVGYVIGLVSYFVVHYWLLQKLTWWVHTDVVGQYMDPSTGDFALLSSTDSAYRTEGSSMVSLVCFMLTGIATFPTYLCISLLLPYLCNLAHGQGRHLGRVYGLNTVAFMLGMVAFNWLAPWVNMFYAFRLVELVLVVLVVFTLFLSEKHALRKTVVVGAVLGVAGSAAFASREFDHGRFPENTTIAQASVRSMRGSPGYTTFISEQVKGDALYLCASRMSDTTVLGRRYMKLHAHYPMLSHPDPKKVLIICFGVGNTAGAAAKHKSLERLDLVDLSRNILETSFEFSYFNDRVFEDPRVRLVHDDGRSFLSTTNEQYDLITSEPPPPLMLGISRLYSKEYYEDVLEHLTPQGFMTQWLPIYQMPPRACTMMVNTFVQTFPHVMLATGGGREYILIGSKGPIDLTNVIDRFAAEDRVRGDLQTIGIARPADMFAGIVMTDAELRRWFGEGEVVSDQRNPLANFWPTGRMISFPYDPYAVLEALPDEIAAPGFGVREIVTDFTKLRSTVPQFPADVLVYAERSGPIRGADIDWLEVDRLNRYSERAVVSGNVQEALTFLERSAELAPDQLEVVLRWGFIHMRAGNHEEAARAFRRMIALDPDGQVGYFLFGQELFQLRRVEEALAAVDRALAINPYYFDAYLLKGRILAAVGDREGALQHFERALELKPRNEDALELLDRLRTGA